MASPQSRYFDRLIKEERESMVDVKGEYYLIAPIGVIDDMDKTPDDLIFYKELDDIENTVDDLQDKVVLFTKVDIKNFKLWDVNDDNKYGTITDEYGMLNSDVIEDVKEKFPKIKTSSNLFVFNMSENMGATDAYNVISYAVFNPDEGSFTEFKSKDEIKETIKGIYEYE